ncbi:MAG: hypothetical protein A3G25_00620 [Betaproteobacteria bacterium RIFCSPLOWO2_12_FULL_63_13]|nr:MAG: hypothetical protein A3G25_00620 [Betaproteobacteria bacterium RIFCSPLOWO2_12_FULL_63_13]
MFGDSGHQGPQQLEQRSKSPGVRTANPPVVSSARRILSKSLSLVIKQCAPECHASSRNFWSSGSEHIGGFDRPRKRCGAGIAEYDQVQRDVGVEYAAQTARHVERRCVF